MPDGDAQPPEPEDPAERERLRRLLDGYAEPGRLRRLQDRQRRKQTSRLGRLRQRLVRRAWFRSRGHG